MLVAENILPTQQHLQLCVRHFCTHFAQTLPRILVQIPQADIKCRTAPALHGIKPRLVYPLKDGLKFVIGKSRGDKRLVCVTQYGFGELDFLHIFPP